MYECEYSYGEQMFPRHFSSSYSVCREAASLPLEEALAALPPALARELLERGEALVADEAALRALLGRASPSGYAVVRLAPQPKAYFADRA